MPLRPSHEYLDAYAVPGEHWIVDVIDPDSGLTAVCGSTADEIRAKYPTAERIAIADWQAARAAEQDAPITWARTTRAKYHEMLEILPPALWIGGAFLVGEPFDHHATTGRPRFAAYWHRGAALPWFEGSYFVASRPLTRPELRAIVAGAQIVAGAPVFP